MTSVVKHITRKPAADGDAALKATATADRSRTIQLYDEFPPRPQKVSWPHTEASIEEVQDRLTLPPLSEEQ